jgi:glycosyltransferase involved in cell wall biosynthesis
VGDNPYYVKEGINGLLAPVGDTEALSEALHRCLEQPWHADAISRSLAVGTWNQVASSVLTAFQGRLGARRALS